MNYPNIINNVGATDNNELDAVVLNADTATLANYPHQHTPQGVIAPPASAHGAMWGNIPAELRKRPQWCLANANKAPLMTDGKPASSTDPATWGDFDSVCAAAHAKGLNIGYVLSAGDPYTCIDMDVKDSTDPRVLQGYEATIAEFDSYTEKSASGKGFHTWVLGSIGKGARREGVEVYSQERFIICTGNTFLSRPIASKPQELNALVNELRPNKTAGETQPSKPQVWDDADIIKLLANDHISEELYAGRWKKHFESQSEADLTLMAKLAGHSQNDAQLERLFHSSALGQREKAHRRDYLEATIRKARPLGSAEAERTAIGKRAKEAIVNNWLREQKQEAQSKIKLVTAAEMCKRPPLKWLVKGVLPDTGVAVIYGPPSCGKSFLALDLLAHISAGEPWFGYKTRRVPVAYVAFEGAYGIGQRVKAFAQHRKALPDIQFVETEGINLMEKTDCAALAEKLAPVLRGSGVVCIDTLAASAPGMDENTSAGMGKLIDQFKAIQAELGGLFLAVHHSGKDASKGERGWSGLRGALDASIEVMRDDKSEERSWHARKIKDDRDGQKKNFTLDTVIIDHDEDGDAITSCVVSPYAAPQVDRDKQDAEVGKLRDEQDAEFIFNWVKNKCAEGEYPSKNSLEGHDLNAMKATTPSITQKRVRSAVDKLCSQNRLVQEKRPNGNKSPYFRAVDIP